jgi:cardiolipin synthase
MSVFWGFLLALGLFHTIAVALLILKVIQQQRDSSATLAWILVMLFLPGLGAVFFWLLGSTRVKLIRRKRIHVEQRLAPSLDRFRQSHNLTENDTAVALTLYSLATSLDECGPQPDCDVTLYRQGSDAFDALVANIDAATHHVHLIYYIWEPDITGTRFLNALVRAAQRGVEVRLLIDGLGSFRAKTDFFMPLIHAGGEVSRFSPINLLSRHVSLNNRNHRKIVVIDGITGYTGSMNVGDLYAGLSVPWSDLHMRVTGRVVYELQRVFCQDWYHTTEKDLSVKDYFPVNQVRGDVCAHFLASGPSDEHWRGIHTMLFTAINTARERVWIETPYFVPDSPILMALQAAALKGVDVRLLLPNKSDQPLALHAGRSFFDDLLEAGVHIFEMNEIIPHAKTVIIDEIFATAGSTNMDQRSFRLNFEGNLLFFSKRIVAEMARDFLQQSNLAFEITSDSRNKITDFQRIKEGFCRILAPLL